MEGFDDVTFTHEVLHGGLLIIKDWRSIAGKGCFGGLELHCIVSVRRLQNKQVAAVLWERTSSSIYGVLLQIDPGAIRTHCNKN